MANKKLIEKNKLIEDKYNEAFKDICYGKDDLFNMAKNLGEKEIKDVLYGLFLNFVTGEDYEIGNGGKAIIFETMLKKQKNILNKFKKNKNTKLDYKDDLTSDVDNLPF